MPEQDDIKKVKIPETVTVKHFSEILDAPVSVIITELMKNKIVNDSSRGHKTNIHNTSHNVYFATLLSSK